MNGDCYICTGQKRVLHTLWVGSIREDIFIQNLPVDKRKAIAFAKEYSKKNDYHFVGVQDSPTFGKAKHVDHFGIDFKHKRKHTEGGVKEFYYGEATPEFWDAWKKDKQQLKEKGFRVSKYSKPDGRHAKRIEVWYVFYKPQGD